MAGDVVGAEGNVRAGEPVSGSVSATSFGDDVLRGIKDHLRDAVDPPHLPELPTIPTWFWILSAGLGVSVVYLGYRAVKATGPVLEATAPLLIPLALGAPPSTALAMQQIAARNPRAAVGAGVPPVLPAALGEPRPAPAPASAPDLSAILALAPALGASGAGTASALTEIAANLNRLASQARGRRVGSGTASKTMVSAS